MIAAAVVALALGHPQGFHQRVSLAVSRQAVDGLTVLEVDSGEKGRLLRAGADANHDGLISTEERGALQKKLTALATRGLKLGVAGFPLALKVTEVKLSLRDDHRAGDAGLSLAVLFEATVKSAIGEGMSLEVEARSPDESHVLVEVTAMQSPDGGPVALERREVQPGERWSVRLGKLHGR